MIIKLAVGFAVAFSFPNVLVASDMLQSEVEVQPNVSMLRITEERHDLGGHQWKGGDGAG